MNRLTTTEAARRLGVKPATIYAYVSRGHLTSRPSDDGRSSTFSAAEVEELARRGRPRQTSRSRSLDFTIDTAITSITDDRLLYRGRDAVQLASTVAFEQAADLLLLGTLDDYRPWPSNPRPVPETRSVSDHLALTALVVGGNDPFRSDLDRRAVAAAARATVTAIVDSRPPLGEGRTPQLELPAGTARATLAGRLWTRLSPRRPPAGMIAVLNAALVLLADHELAVSTVAARVAASARADPYAVVTAGAAAFSGPLHGGASRNARRMIDAAVESSSIDVTLGSTLERFGRYPGFGHAVYRRQDPRAAALLAMLRDRFGGTPVMNSVDGIIATVRRRRDLLPNVDLALAAMGALNRFDESSGELLFATARVAGWIAHAMEEYDEAPLRFRARANPLPTRP